MTYPSARDEFGLPAEWRRSVPEEVAIDESVWATFEAWCADHGRRSFPASPGTVLRFVLSGSCSGPDLCTTWLAIHLKHEAHYWHTDANPVRLLELGGVRVEADGTLAVPDVLIEDMNEGRL